jgi:NhaP-type Na+/H+ or K+/H+ antiporter
MSANKENPGHETPQQGRIGPRPFWVLKLSILIRALHQVGAAVFLAAYLLDDIPAVPQMYLYLALISGVALFFTEWLRHREIYRELSGLGTFIKLLLLGTAFHGFLPQTAAIIGAFLLASICAHAPKQYRHRVLF